MTNEEAINFLKSINKEDTAVCCDGALFTLDEYGVEIISMAIEALEAEAEWIPVTDRLPENEHVVLLTIKSTLGDNYYVTEAIVGRIVNEGSLLNGIRFYTERYGDIDEQHGYKVIAWQRLPEPYREDGE